MMNFMILIKLIILIITIIINNNHQDVPIERRFSDQQLRLLQDAFEANPYPKDDDLEILSQEIKTEFSCYRRLVSKCKTKSKKIL